MKFRIRGRDEIQQRIVDRLVARTVLSDLAPGDPLMQFAGAVATELEEMYLSTARLLELFNIDDATGADLDRRAAEVLPDGLQRRGAARAVGELRWITQAPVVVDVPIPAGTTAAKPGSPRVLYVTTAPGIIRALSTQSERADGVDGGIPAAAVAPGEAGNAELDTVNVFVAAVPNAARVTNPIPFAKGVDAESDDELRARIRAHTRSLSRCIHEALEVRARQAEVAQRRVVASKVWEDPVHRGSVTVFIDDGSGAVTETAQAPGEVFVDAVAGAVGGEQEFYLRHAPARGPVTIAYLSAGGVSRVLQGSVAPASAPGDEYLFIPARGYVWLHPAAFPTGLNPGDRLAVAPYAYYTGLIREAQRLIDGDPRDVVDYPAWRAAGVVVTVAAPLVRQVQVRVHISALPDANRALVVAEVRRRLSEYVNGLGIGAALIRAELVERAMGVPGMYDMGVELPAQNVPVAFNQVVRVTSGNLEVI